MNIDLGQGLRHDLGMNIAGHWARRCLKQATIFKGQIQFPIFSSVPPTALHSIAQGRRVTRRTLGPLATKENLLDTLVVQSIAHSNRQH